MCDHPECDGESQCNHWSRHRGKCLCERHINCYQCTCTCGCPGTDGDHDDFCDQCGQCIGYGCGCVGGFLVQPGEPKDEGVYCHLCADSFQLEGHINLTE